MQNDLNRPDQENEEKEGDDIVITPGGPRPRSLVQEVGPDEKVVIDKERRPEVVPRQDKSSED